MEAEVDPRWAEAFERDGYVVTPDVLERDELAGHGAAVDRVVASRTTDDHRAMHEKSSYEQSFVQCMRLWQDQALYKEPGGQDTEAHQDAPFWPIGDTPLVSAWIPFDGSTLEAGAMSYVPGSHKAGRLRPVDITRSTEPYDILRDPALEGREPVVVEAAPGSVVWHHGATVHRAAPNRSDRVALAGG